MISFVSGLVKSYIINKIKSGSMMLFNHVGLDPIEMVAEMVDGKRVYLTPEGLSFRLSPQ